MIHIKKYVAKGSEEEEDDDGKEVEIEKILD